MEREVSDIDFDILHECCEELGIELVPATSSEHIVLTDEYGEETIIGPNDEVEQVYQEFWKDIICNDDGSINVEQLKKELYDCSRMLDNVPAVYCEVTGGSLSYPTYKAETVLNIFREKYYDKAWAVDLLADDWDLITAECETNEDYKKAIFEYLGTEE